MRPPSANGSQPRQSRCAALGVSPATATPPETAITSSGEDDAAQRAAGVPGTLDDRGPEDGAERQRAQCERMRVLEQHGGEADAHRDGRRDQGRAPRGHGENGGECEPEGSERDETVEAGIGDRIERRAHGRRVVQRRPRLVERPVGPRGEGGARGEERRARGDPEPRTHALEESRSHREDRHGDERGR